MSAKTTTRGAPTPSRLGRTNTFLGIAVGKRKTPNDQANRLVRLSERLGGDETLEDGVVRTEHTLDWSKTAQEIADEYEAGMIERDVLREKLDDCLESLRLIERVTRPDGDMADAAVNLLVRSCRWEASDARTSAAVRKGR